MSRGNSLKTSKIEKIKKKTRKKIDKIEKKREKSKNQRKIEKSEKNREIEEKSHKNWKIVHHFSSEFFYLQKQRISEMFMQVAQIFGCFWKKLEKKSFLPSYMMFEFAKSSLSYLKNKKFPHFQKLGNLDREIFWLQILSICFQIFFDNCTNSF